MSQRDERGAIFPMTVILMGVILLIASLVIDIGSDRLVRRDMQSMSDVIALDVVRELDGRTAAAYAGYSSSGPSAALLATAKNESVARQGSNFTDPDAVRIRLAVADKNTGAFVRWAAAGDVPNAVRVYSEGSSAFRFLPTTPRRENLERSALAVIGPPIVCVAAGATFAEVTPQGPLDTMLGKLVGVDRLTVLDPYGLASLDLEIPLIDLATALGVGSVSELLTANVSYQDFVLAIAEVLPHKGNSANVSLLDAISTGLPDTDMDVSDILNLDTGNGSGAGLVVNTFSLVQSTIMASNLQHFVTLGNTISVPGLSKIDLSAKVIEPPQIACGPVGTTARSAQIEVRLKAEVKALNGLVASADIDPLFINVAAGTATITGVTCSATSKTVSVAASTSAAQLGIRVLTELLLGLTSLEIAAPDPAASPNGASIGSSSGQSLNFTFTGTDIPPGQTAGSQFANLGLSSLSPIKIVVSGLPVGGLLDGIVKPLLALIDPLVTSLLQSVLSNLGISVGTVRVQPVSHPSCNEPQLRD